MCIRDSDFSDEETKLLKQVDDIKTFDDVMKLAKELLAWQKQKDEEMFANNMDVSADKQQSEDGESESDYSDDDGQMRDEDSHDDSGQDSSQDSEGDETERKDDETYSEYQQRLKDLENVLIITKFLYLLIYLIKVLFVLTLISCLSEANLLSSIYHNHPLYLS